MKLARGGPIAHEIPLVGDSSDGWFDLRSVVADLDRAALEHDLERIGSALTAGQLPRVAQPDRFGPPLAPAGNIICIGMNYSDHAAETGATVPTEPIVFLKTRETVIWPGRRGSGAAPVGEDRLRGGIGDRDRVTCSLPRITRARSVIAGYAINQEYVRERACEAHSPTLEFFRSAF